MAKTRLNIPTYYLVNKSPEDIAKTYKAVATRYLKLYTDDRAKRWITTFGMLKNGVKTVYNWAASFFVATKTSDHKLSPAEITNFHDNLKEEIIYLNKYEDYIKFINKLNIAAQSATESSNYRCLRTDVYYAIILLLLEAVQQLFPEEYQEDLRNLNAKYAQLQIDYTDRFDSSHDITDVWNSQIETLIQLVLRGEISKYQYAFQPDRNLFPHLAAITTDDKGTYKDLIRKQFEMEEKRKINDLTLPFNKNHPYQIQRFFPRYLYGHAFELTNMEMVVQDALQDRDLMNGETSLYQKYLNKTLPNPASLREPPDRDELIPREQSPVLRSSREANNNNAVAVAAQDSEPEEMLSADSDNNSPYVARVN